MNDDGWLDDVPPVNLGEIRAAIARLAELDRLSYDRERTAAAKSLGLRTSTLDAEVARLRKPPLRCVEPEEAPELVENLEVWPEEVDGLALAEGVRETLRRHVVFGSPSDADAATLWVVGSYLMGTWRLWPRLLISSPVRACGKTTLLEVLEALTWRGLLLSNARAAGVFRAIEAWSPTLLCDEADTWAKDDSELAGILNSGHSRRTARVIRVAEKGGELIPTAFSTWCSMAIAGIGGMRDTLTSRSIVISLRRRLPSEHVARLPADLFERMQPARRQLLRWTRDNAARISASDTEPPACGDDRRQDNFGPLWRIAEALGGAWPDRLAAAYLARGEGEDDDADEPAGIMVLRDLADIFAMRNATHLQSNALVVALCDLEDRPWMEWKRGHPLTPQSLARLLRPFKIRPRNVRTGGHVLKSYAREDVEAAFSRYGSKNPLHGYTPENTGNSEFPIRHASATGSATPSDKCEQNQSCSGVAAKSGYFDPFSEDR